MEWNDDACDDDSVDNIELLRLVSDHIGEYVIDNRIAVESVPKLAMELFFKVRNVASRKVHERNLRWRGGASRIEEIEYSGWPCAYLGDDANPLSKELDGLWGLSFLYLVIRDD